MVAHTGEDQRQVVADILRAFRAVAPDIPTTTVLAATMKVIPGNVSRTRAARQLRTDPEVLIRGDSLALPALNRLIRYLRSEGYTSVEIPRCSECDRALQIPHRDGQGGRRCSACNRTHASPPCTRCAAIKPSGYRILEGQPYCMTCWRRDPRTFAVCSRCAQTGPVGRRLNGEVLCERCYVPPSRTCVRCERARPAALNKNGVVLCEGCYSSLRQQLRTCASCQERRVCPHWRDTGPICADCAGAATGRCTACGATDRRLNGLRCLACVAPEMLRTVISDRNGQPHPQLLPLEGYLLQDRDRAEAVVGWIRKSPMSQVVRQMARGELPISLNAVASLPATGASGYLAALLMEAGIVPEENFDRLRLEHWEREEFANLRNPDHRHLLHRYAAWVVNRKFPMDPRLAASDQSLRLTRSRTHLTHIMDLLNAIDTLGFDLDTFPQRAFDEWVAVRGERGHEVTRFVRWARTQRITRLNSVHKPRIIGTVTITDDVRWDWMKRLLSSEEIRLNWRLGGLLAILYGVLVTRVVALPLSAVDISGAQVRLSLGREPIILPDALGDLVRRQIADGLSRDPERRWLFPGIRPGQHLSARALKSPLAKRGIHLGQGRIVALMTLSQEIAPSVLTDLLGISIEAAMRWSRLAGRDWNDYPRLRMLDVDTETLAEP